jgi:hypothetical protein
MAINYPGPYVLKMFYSVNASAGGVLQHVCNVNVDCASEPSPGDEFDEIALAGSVSNVAADTYADNFRNYTEDFLDDTEATIDRFELWKIDEDSFDGVFISQYDVNAAGVHTGSVFAAHVDIYTFRTAEGGIMKVQFLDTNIAGNSIDTYANMTQAQKDFVDFILGSPSYGKVALARDTSLPIGFLHWCPGQHEVTYRQRYR